MSPSLWQIGRPLVAALAVALLALAWIAVFGFGSRSGGHRAERSPAHRTALSPHRPGRSLPERSDGSTHPSRPQAVRAHGSTRPHAKGAARRAAAPATAQGATFAPSEPTEAVSFDLSGHATDALFPGGTSAPVELVITNPSTAPLTVVGVTTTIAGTSVDGCRRSNFRIVRQLSSRPVVPGRTTRSLSQLGIPRSRWPQLRMLETGTNQNGCRNAQLRLAFRGAGRFGR